MISVAVPDLESYISHGVGRIISLPTPHTCEYINYREALILQMEVTLTQLTLQWGELCLVIQIAQM